jgi:hypothetical protein
MGTNIHYYDRYRARAMIGAGRPAMVAGIADSLAIADVVRVLRSEQV